MIKFIKKHKLNFISYLFCALALAIFTIISFSCKTYAYTIDNNGNLVGDNLFYINTSYYNDFGGVVKQYNPQTQVLSLNGVNTISESNGVLNDFDLQQGTYYLQSFYIDGTSNGAYRLVAHTLDWSWQTTLYIGYENSLTTFTVSESSNIVRLEFYGDLNTFYNLNNYISISKNELTEWEPYGIWYSKSNYDTLQNQLDTTNGLLDLQIDITKYGWLSYIDNLEYYVTGNYVQTFSFNDLKTNNYISNNATLDLYQMSLYQNPNYSFIKFDIYFQNSYANLDYFSANLFDLSTKLGFNGVVSIYDTDSNSAVFNIVDIASITYEDIIAKNSNFGDYIYNVTFEFASPDAATMIYTNSFYTRGYQTGYSYGSNVSTGYYTPIINDLNARISNLENDILSLNNTIDTLKELNAQYQQQLADNVGWSSLFFAFADTPFKVVSNVLGFELFGLNLFATFIGMITVFGVVYLLKKFL